MLIGYGSHEYAPQPADPGHRYQQTRCYGDFTRHADDAKSAALALWVGKPGDQNSGIFVSINANLTPYILYSARQNDFSGIALAIDHTAISTFSNRLVDPQTLHNAPIRQAQIEAYR
ncbi:phage resistance protein [Serratia liquefaciens]|nr:phage resistance protein [Serratia liquefaciens]